MVGGIFLTEMSEQVRYMYLRRMLSARLQFAAAALQWCLVQQYLD
jgi:hypothetical protein